MQFFFGDLSQRENYHARIKIEKSFLVELKILKPIDKVEDGEKKG